MIDGGRVASRMADLGLSQAAVARQVGVSQPTIYKMIHENKSGSVHLHKVARVLLTTPAFLTRETDDPDSDAPDAPLLGQDDLELLDLIQTLDPKSRAALVQIVRALAAGGQVQAQTLHAPRHQYRAA